MYTLGSDYSLIGREGEMPMSETQASSVLAMKIGLHRLRESVVVLKIILTQGCLDLTSEGEPEREEAKTRSGKLVQFLKFTVKIEI